jgi:hypothetical protein
MLRRILRRQWHHVLACVRNRLLCRRRCCGHRHRLRRHLRGERCIRRGDGCNPDVHTCVCTHSSLPQLVTGGRLLSHSQLIVRSERVHGRASKCSGRRGLQLLQQWQCYGPDLHTCLLGHSQRRRDGTRWLHAELCC